MTKRFVRVRSGGHKAGMVLSVHRSFNAAMVKSGTRPFETLFTVEFAAKVGDFIADWADRHAKSLQALRRSV